MKRLLALLAGIVALAVSMVPFSLRRRLWFWMLAVESRIGRPDAALRRLFVIWDGLDLIVNERSTAYGNGINPKHRLTGYHDFFIANISPSSTVLDAGCGIGAVARSIAARAKNVHVTAIDSDPEAIERARAETPLANLEFLLGDIACLPASHWDVIVLSNVLEHAKDRKSLLDGLRSRHTPKRLLIRVPLFERHWHLPLRRELGVNYFSDPTHHVEHTLAEFEKEMAESGFEIKSRLVMWGEIWAVCEPI